MSDLILRSRELPPLGNDCTFMQMSSQPGFLYFAYGSNLLTPRLIARAPSARKLSTGTLHEYRLAWHKAGEDGSGKCDVVASTLRGAAVHGVVYQIDLAEKPRLDAAESLGIGYRQKQVAIASDRGLLDAWLYCAIALDASALPYDWYHALVLAGAREHGFPAIYINGLEAVVTKPDADRLRAERHFGLIAKAPKKSAAKLPGAAATGPQVACGLGRCALPCATDAANPRQRDPDQ